MIFVILFQDDPAHADKRMQYMQDHLAFLRRNAERVRGAGPMVTADGNGAGGLWVVEAESFDAARHLAETDPLFSTGLRRKITILEWKQVFTSSANLVA